MSSVETVNIDLHQTTKPVKQPLIIEICIECGGILIRNGKCRTCNSCGWSSCSVGLQN